MRVQTAAALVLLLLAKNIFAQYPNFRVHPSLSNQIEPSIVYHPENPQIMFASSFTIRSSFRSEGAYVSTNGGTNWFGVDTLFGNPYQFHGGDPGPIIDKNGRFIITHQGGTILGMYSNYSSNQGTTWSNTIAIASNDQDKGSPGTDGVQSSAYYGRTYLVWTRFSPPYPIVISHTTNGAESWTTVIQINNTPAGHYSLGPSLAVGPTGQVYACWAASILNSPFNEDFIGFAVSSNGGVNWNVWENAYDCNGIKTTQLPPWDIRVNSYPLMDVDKTGGPRNGWIYIVVSQKNLPPAGSDPDVIFHRSTNGGVNWSPGVRVNQDQLNNGKIQFFPAITVDSGGGINIVYYDNRNGTDSVELFISRSTDGGNTWVDHLISDHKFRPRAVTGAGSGNMGDNIGITSANGKLYPVWMDNKVSDDVFQVWTAVIDYTTIGIKKISSEIPAQFELKQNYPNPFNPSTTIGYDVAEPKFVVLRVYDYTGKLIRTLTESKLEAGKYRTVFDGFGLASGVYFYTLSTNGFTQTKKMILVK